jgi:DNA-binding NarL/FixJ family response regulator
MKLEYRILWFEDIRSSFDAKKEGVREIVEDLGFTFPEPRNEVNGDNLDTIDLDDFDLIIVDLKLDKINGARIIERIRNYQIYTEVIFYSSAGEQAVRDELKQHNIDGVYCADRKDADFRDKVEKVIKTTIRKVQEVSSMRGLIMSAVSDLDYIMVGIVDGFFQSDAFTPEEKANVATKVFQEVGGAVNEKKDKFDKYEKNGRIDQVIKDNVMFDSSKKAHALQFIIDEIKHGSIEHLKSDVFLGEYLNQVIKVRNNFAHVIEVVEDGVRKLKSKSSEEVFTDERCIEIRKSILVQGETVGLVKTVVCPA